MKTTIRSSGDEKAAIRPQRPRLAEHVSARQHVRGSTSFVVLLDARRDTVDRIDRRTWTVLSVADGTRDLEGIRLAARRIGAPATIVTIRELFDELGRRGMLCEGPPSYEPDRVRTGSVVAEGDRAIERLGDFTLHCDGSGECCRQYQTILFTPEDAARARAWVPGRTAGPIPAERLLVPVRGSAPAPLQTVTLEDGACAYLDADGGCSIHRAGGSFAKPHGCSAFPLRLCDDGTTVRQSVRLECACVLESIGRDDGELLLDPTIERVADLPAITAIDVIPTHVTIREGETVPRERLRSWTDALLSLPEAADPAAQLWSWADVLEAQGLRHEGPRAGVSRIRPEAPAVWVEALHRIASARLRCDAGWRGDGDRILQALRWIVATTSVVRHPGVWAEVMALEPPSLLHESFYLRATAFGQQWVDGRPLVTSLRDRAVRLWLARCMPTFGALVDEASSRHPLVLIEVLMRAHQLARYTDGL